MGFYLFKAALILLPIGLVISAIIVLYFVIRNIFNKRAAAICAALLALFFAYIGYYAVYPDDDFYRSEFKAVLGIECPESSKIIFKDMITSGIHPDYSSTATFEFSSNDYQNLLKYFINDYSYKDSIEVDDTGYVSIEGYEKKVLVKQRVSMIIDVDMSYELHRVRFIPSHNAVMVYRFCE